ncbi:MAG: hypothetical protein QI223_01050 [Candidatus Korarchaeota archaeon]|nr:hypothetical protein [Candidatus Korarchaeota archaeon]
MSAGEGEPGRDGREGLPAEEYSVVAELDISGRSKKCVESPLVSLTRAMSTLRSGEAILVRFDPERTPARAIQLMATKKGLGFSLLSKGETHSCLIYSPR